MITTSQGGVSVRDYRSMDLVGEHDMDRPILPCYSGATSVA
jgi:hypothetical protein